MVIILTIIALVFAFYAPFYLKKNSEKIKPTRNIFDEFVDNDLGYPWSMNSERKENYKKELMKKRNNA